MTLHDMDDTLLAAEERRIRDRLEALQAEQRRRAEAHLQEVLGDCVEQFRASWEKAWRAPSVARKIFTVTPL